MKIETTFVHENETERINFRPCSGSEGTVLAYNEEAWDGYFRKIDRIEKQAYNTNATGADKGADKV